MFTFEVGSFYRIKHQSLSPVPLRAGTYRDVHVSELNKNDIIFILETTLSTWSKKTIGNDILFCKIILNGEKQKNLICGDWVDYSTLLEKIV